MTLLTVTNLVKRAENDFVLNDVSFSLNKNQKIAIMGETGSGKSTLLKMIAGLIQPDGGAVYFNQTKVEGPQETLVPGFPGISYLSQHVELPHALRVEQVLRYSNSIDEEAAAVLYEICHVSHLLKRYTNQLSGGEQQRIALARLLVSSPQLLLLDEPFSNLDVHHKKVLKDVIENSSKKLGITCILVSHEPADVLSWADKILIIKNGLVIQKGTPKKIYNRPLSEYVAGLLGTYTLLDPAVFNILGTLSGLNAVKKNCILRPEHFKLSLKKPKAVGGRVLKLAFFGSYYEATVLLLNTEILVRTTMSTLKKGDRVYITLSPEYGSFTV